MSKITKVTDKELEELKRENSNQKIIYMHIMSVITLSSKQLDYLLNEEDSKCK